MSRFYDLDKGRILCNGEDIARSNVYSYRQHLSLVAQEATLFRGKHLKSAKQFNTVKTDLC